MYYDLHRDLNPYVLSTMVGDASGDRRVSRDVTKPLRISQLPYRVMEMILLKVTVDLFICFLIICELNDSDS